jgi:hypothetical protein
MEATNLPSAFPSQKPNPCTPNIPFLQTCKANRTFPNPSIKLAEPVPNTKPHHIHQNPIAKPPYRTLCPPFTISSPAHCCDHNPTSPWRTTTPASP